jgi:hypothetical protein
VSLFFDIHTTAIAGATLLAIFALGVEYFTRAFSSRFLAMWRRRAGDAPIDRIDDARQASATEVAAEPRPSPVLIADIPARREPPVVAPSATATLPNEVRAGQERSADAIFVLVRDLGALERAFGGARGLVEAVGPCRKLESGVMEYSVDDLMEIPDDDLGRCVAEFYRRVSTMVSQARGRLERVLPTDLDGAEALSETERESLRRDIAAEIERGTRLARRLRYGTTFTPPEPTPIDAASNGRRRHPRDQRLPELAKPIPFEQSPPISAA